MKCVMVRAVVLVVLALAGLTMAGPADNVVSAIKGLTPGEPVQHGNLTVFPLTGRSTGSGNYVTLDKAIREGWVQVEEKDGGSVNTVRVRNRSDKYVFGMAGEIVTGAKQNRMLQRDVLLDPKSGWLDLSVYCVEHGRWSGASMEFSSKGQIAAGRVRGKAANCMSQGEVWAEVAENNADLGIAAPTDRFDAVYDDKDVQKKLADYKEEIEKKLPTLTPNALGVAVAVGDRIVCVDAFSSPKLFKKMWPRLLESYVVDAISQRPKSSTDREDVAGFLKAASEGEVVSQPAVGSGTLMRLESDEAAGSALVSGKEVIHLDLFPADEEEDSPLRLDIRRDGLQR